MYDKILLALDGSYYSELGIEGALKIAKFSNPDTILYGCHVYASKMHKVRFTEMETGLPQQYQTEEKLTYLRDTHEDLITDGMQLISDAYLSPLVQRAMEESIKVEGITPEGRNYAKLLEVVNTIKPDLIVLGGWGHGKVDEKVLGSLTQRILMYAPKSDILIMKKPMIFKYNPIVVGIDGSQNAYAALAKALDFAKIFQTEINAIAVYDPYFHSGVFRKIADVLPEEDQKKFNFVAQERLHDEIIDKGLEKLYLEALKKAEMMASSLNIPIKLEVLSGKVFSKIVEFSNLKNSDLLVVGRWGLHKEDSSLIGSHSFNSTILSKSNVLIVTPGEKSIDVPQLKPIDQLPIKWTAEAAKVSEKIPPFVRGMAKKMIEDYARDNGFSEVTPELVENLASKFGMESKLPINEEKVSPSHKELSKNTEILEAEKIIFRKVKRLAPSFHQNILKSKILGEVLENGQKILVYKVKEIFPQSPALITEKTVIEFE